MTNTGCRHCNAKTIISFDTTTVCAKARRGHPCIYCYVASSRNEGFRAKSVITDDKYDGWVKRLRPETMVRLEAVGGLRMFAFGDYLSKHKKEVRAFLEDCQDIMMPVKVITKVVAFVRDWVDHPAISVLNVSIDSLKKGGRSPISLEVARKLRKNYRKVKIRAVILSDEDVKFYGSKKYIDVLTLNHGRNAFKSFSHAELEKVATKYPGRVCCIQPTCEGCKVRCGLGEAT